MELIINFFYKKEKAKNIEKITHLYGYETNFRFDKRLEFFFFNLSFYIFKNFVYAKAMQSKWQKILDFTTK